MAPPLRASLCCWFRPAAATARDDGEWIEPLPPPPGAETAADAPAAAAATVGRDGAASQAHGDMGATAKRGKEDGEATVKGLPQSLTREEEGEVALTEDMHLSFRGMARLSMGSIGGLALGDVSDDEDEASPDDRPL